jgi:formylglycine-generating enzyme required for sulfatase activity
MTTPTPDYERLCRLVAQGDREAARALIPLTRRAGDLAWSLRAADVLAAEDVTPWTVQTPWIELIVIPRGPFWSGWWKLEVQDVPTFALARHPVTNAQYHAFLKDSGYEPSPRPTNYLKHWKKADAPPEEIWDHPVRWISWRDALACCAWAGLTLPTALMWQKAARGLDGRPAPWGHAKASPDLLRFKARTTGPVDEFAHVRSAWGCVGMLGNVSCWCLPSDMANIDPKAILQRHPRPDVPINQQNQPICGVSADCHGPTHVHAAAACVGLPTGCYKYTGFRPAITSAISPALFSEFPSP